MTQLATASSATFIALDASYVYWIESTKDLKRVAVEGGAPQVVSTEAAYAGLAIDTTDIYWGDGAGVVNQAPLGGGTASQVVAGLPVYGLAIDDTYLYWTAYGADQKGLVLKAQK